MIKFSDAGFQGFKEERVRLAKPGLGVQIAFTYGCGGAGFRVTFTDDPADHHMVQEDRGVRIWLDSQSAAGLDGAVIDHDGTGFLLRHSDAAIVEFC